MEENLKVGDVVRLKSGGIKMTVYYAKRDSKNEEQVSLIWYNEITGNLCYEHGVISSVLEKVNQS